MTPSPSQPLEGIRVLDVGHIIAGPMVASLLADFGADVIKIERPVVGDSMRWFYKKDGVGLFHKVEARNKRSVTLDLARDRGREIFHELVKKSDVVVENYRPGVMEKLGNDWNTLRRLNPRLVYCRVSGWGQTGPMADRRAYGRLAESFAGFAHLTGERDGPPMHSAMSLGDSTAAVWAAWGVMMALYWRDVHEGTGQVIDVGLYEPLYRQIEQQIVVYDQLGTVVTRAGNMNPGTPVLGCYETADGGYFSFSAQTQRTITAVLTALGLQGDERFNTFDACLQNHDLFDEWVSEWMSIRTLREVETEFERADAPGVRVMSAADLIDHPHIAARNMVVTVPDAELGDIRMQGVVPKMSETPGAVRHAGQALGQSNSEVFGELLEMTEDELARLRADAVI